MTKNVPPTHLSNLMLLKVNGSGGDSSENGSTRKMASCSSNSDLNYSTTTGTGNTGTHNAKMLDLEKKQWKKPPQTVAYLAKLATLVELSPNVFRADELVPGFSWTTNVYGGLTFAQSMLAAELTTEEKFQPHAIHSFFMLNGTIEKPIEYRVQRARDGRSFCTRLVQAVQDDQIIFTAQASLHVKEPSAIEHQQKMPVVPSPDELSPYFELVRRAIQDHESGVRPLRDFRLKHLNHHLLEEEMVFFEFRPVDPNRFLAIEPHAPGPECFWMRCKISMPDALVAQEIGLAQDEALAVRRLHRFMLAYVTDSTLVSTANRAHFSHGYMPSMLFTLDHSVHFHDDRFRVDEWLLYENYSPVAKNGRAWSEGRVWTRDGRLVASAHQESLSRTRMVEPQKEDGGGSFIGGPSRL